MGKILVQSQGKLTFQGGYHLCKEKKELNKIKKIKTPVADLVHLVPGTCPMPHPTCPLATPLCNKDQPLGYTCNSCVDGAQFLKTMGNTTLHHDHFASYTCILGEFAQKKSSKICVHSWF